MVVTIEVVVSELVVSEGERVLLVVIEGVECEVWPSERVLLVLGE